MHIDIKTSSGSTLGRMLMVTIVIVLKDNASGFKTVISFCPKIDKTLGQRLVQHSKHSRFLLLIVSMIVDFVTPYFLAKSVCDSPGCVLKISWQSLRVNRFANCLSVMNKLHCSICTRETISLCCLTSRQFIHRVILL